MPFELKVIAEPGSATQCGDCPLIYDSAGQDRCRWTGQALEHSGAFYDAGFKRLPECIAAEKAQGGGGGE